MSHVTRVGDVLAALRRAFEKKGWHGASLLEHLRRLTPAQAAFKPKGANHSIHELVDHVAFWEGIGVAYVTAGRPPDPMPKDWTAPGTSLAQSLRTLRRNHKALLGVIARLMDADLGRPVHAASGGRFSLAQVLHGLAAHAAYHAGQIGLLLAMQRRRGG